MRGVGATRGTLSGWHTARHCAPLAPALGDSAAADPTPAAASLRRCHRRRASETAVKCQRCSQLPLSSVRGAKLPAMQPLKAHVKNGRVVLDEPLELPEDTELEVGSLHVVDTGDDFDDEERERLHRALDAAIESVQAGRTVDGNEVIRRLLSRP